MKKLFYCFSLLAFVHCAKAQQGINTETLLQLGRLNALGITKDGKSIVYSVKKFSLAEGKSTTKKYLIPVEGGTPTEINSLDGLLNNDRISPDGKHSISAYEVKVKNIFGKDTYPDVPQSDVMIYDTMSFS